MHMFLTYITSTCSLLALSRRRNYLLRMQMRCSTIFSKGAAVFLPKIYTNFFSRGAAAHLGQRVGPPMALSYKTGRHITYSSHNIHLYSAYWLYSTLQHYIYLALLL
ncbi:hypothetical protein Hanom_Chr08g00691351 [Helianthus anomalus]